MSLVGTRPPTVPYFIACAISVNYANNRERMIMKGVNYSIL